MSRLWIVGDEVSPFDHYDPKVDKLDFRELLLPFLFNRISSQPVVDVVLLK
jgi:hypothetical protein